MKKAKKIYIVTVILLIISIGYFYASYAFFNNTKEEHGKLNIVAGDLKYKLESDSLDNDSIVVEANTSKEIKVKITSLNSISSKYELYYVLDKVNDKVSVGYSSDTKDSVSGIIDTNSNKMITIVIKNESDTNSTITFKVLGGLVNNSLALKDGNSLNKEVNLCSYEKGYVWNFDYTGGEQEFTTPCSGEYKLETWGASGGTYNEKNSGGKGGYSKGNILLNKNTFLYINVGEKGNGIAGATELKNTYNGGGGANATKCEVSSGGGATHISTNSGILSTLEDYKSNILIVSGGGGAGGLYGYGGNAGGYIGLAGEATTTNFSPEKGYNVGYGGNQFQGGSGYNKGSFGQGGIGYSNVCSAMGGGSGLYGGGGGYINPGGGGSSYIGNTSLYDKAMYCYNCEESSEESTKTISTTCTSETPTENCSKQGNGYARITYLGD